MRARKRNPFWGQGLDKRQARRMRRRVAQGKPAMKGGHIFLYDEFLLGIDWSHWERMPERKLFEPCPEGHHEFKPTRHAYLGVGQKDIRRDA